MEGAWFSATGEARSFSEQQLIDCAWDEGVHGCSGGDYQPGWVLVVWLRLCFFAAAQHHSHTHTHTRAHAPPTADQLPPRIHCRWDYVVKAGGVATTQDYPYVGQNDWCR
jgi:hypothetical protein